MTLDEAITELARWHDLPWDENHRNLKKAVQLGIEALRRVRNSRSRYAHDANDPLPGEKRGG